MVAATAALPREKPTRDPWQPYGAAEQLYKRADDEVVLSGPAGTGKSRGCLEYLHSCCIWWPGLRALIVRKTLTSLTASGLVTYQDKVLPGFAVRFFGGSRSRPAAYLYGNGSTVVVGGMDKASKIMSSEYDLIYVQEATELTEPEWEALTTRLRNGVKPAQQIIADCNPDAPTHWLKRRADAGRTVMLESRHEDNPTITPEYIARLDALTGVRYLRLRLGQWAAAEGMVYEGWDRAIHLIDRRELPRLWPRDWSIDFGFTNPFVWQQWCEDPDGRLIREREIYHTQRLVQDHARDISSAAGGIVPRAIYCDHDAEGRATLERELSALYGRTITTQSAYKAIADGTQKVAARLRVAGDGEPRLYLMRDALVERDAWLVEHGLPTCTEEEIDGYVWDTANGRRKGEIPVDRDNHGMDAMRYEVATKDRRRTTAPMVFDDDGRRIA
jgi:hypothetical protein